MRRLVRGLGRTLFVVVLAGALAAVAVIGLGQRPAADPDVRPDAVLAAGTAPAAAAGGDLAATIATLQDRLRKLPRDARAWAALGLVYVEQARVTADPSYYPRADKALARGGDLSPDDDLVLTGRAALAAARHQFGPALELANAALEVNAYSVRAVLIRADALAELGRYDEALAAAERADRLKPGVPTFARLSYARELRGQVPEAIDLMRRAAEAAATPADAAFAYYHVGELERRRGSYAAATRNYEHALRVAPDDVAARAGIARVWAASGDTQRAINAYLDVVTRMPLPEYAIELGELYEAAGLPAKARDQYDVVRAGSALARANGVNVDLEAALFEADHGDPARALRAARTEWQKRHSVAVADAMAWALHAAGRDRAALTYARKATALGTKDARLHYHRGMIEAALGRGSDARRSLRTALDIDPQFSPLHAPKARAALAALGQRS